MVTYSSSQENARVSSETRGMKGTTAGWKNQFAYEKLIQILIQSIIYPEEAIVLGGTWRVPVMAGLLNRTFIQELKLDGTYNDAQFGREYKLICTLKIIENCWKTLRAF